MAGPPKGSKNNPKGRPAGSANKITQDVREILRGVIEELAPQVREKLNQVEDPKDWLMAFSKLTEFVIPKAAPVDPNISNEDLKTLMAMAAKEAAENV